MKRYTVQYSLAKDVQDLFDSGKFDPDDGSIEAALEVEQERSFPNRGLARAFARKVAPDCEWGTARIYTEHLRTIDCYDGGPLLRDWEADENFEEIEAD